MKRRTLIKTAVGALPALGFPNLLKANTFWNGLANTPPITVKGPYKPSWESLSQYQVPNWFRDAKFGIWAHWGPQCQPEFGDWYARKMYIEGSDAYKYHVQKYGHPSRFGFKDVINEWKAENWNPDDLLNLYKRAGAEYFFALANHHDNFDLFPNKYQSWNSTRFGPKKDLIGGWAKAAKAQGMRFGVSVHASHAHTWYEAAQHADKTGAYAGVPYDGNIDLSAGAGTWWEGTDPQELYAQKHPLSTTENTTYSVIKVWEWQKGVNLPSKAYFEKFYNRTLTLINKYEPDLVYFDDTALPLWPVNDAGLRIAAHLYNKSIKKHGQLEAVVFGKILNEQQLKCMVWDIERGQSNRIESLPWQTDTCLGDWHYDRRIYDKKGYKTAKTVIQTLVDVVSKNGNLLLNVPVRGDGTIDEQERAVLEEVALWMDINKESIYGTRPWKILGEGPALTSSAPLTAQGFNEGKGKPFTDEDIRFTAKGNALYAIVLGTISKNKVTVKSLSTQSLYYKERISSVALPGSNQPLNFLQTADGLIINIPDHLQGKYGCAFKIANG
ncbi:alpha-L-fucosidase [Mucilaginibacter terrae]|uniref:alpha-L-fucosidase n=1 Tax=Mucilaginibacter terrae TaxID=1955052 RepID=UPI00362FF6AB